MKFVLLTHSLLSDWNHGNAHFLRGIATELHRRAHVVECWEARDAWSVQGLQADVPTWPLQQLREVYPSLCIRRYGRDKLEIDELVQGADVVLVHEWNDHELVAQLGRRRARGGTFRLLFHDTHHRSVTDPEAVRGYDLSAYDGVLAFGEAIRHEYLAQGWSRRVWTWHEAADVHVFRPLPHVQPSGELVWIGNWGDEERTAELREFLLEPVRQLRLRATVHGVRYPEAARRALAESGIEYRGWIANYQVPACFAAHKVTIHVPRRPYAKRLKGIPTIRVFEALACGIALVSAPWSDEEQLFRPGDLLFARDGRQMAGHLRELLADRSYAMQLGARGRETVLQRHTCAHRVDQLLSICRELGAKSERSSPPGAACGGEE